jgi:Transposase DDE domain
VHYTTDAESRVILDCHLTTGAQHEGTVMPERLAHLLDEGNWPIEEVSADKAYGRGPTYAFLRQHAIRAYIPLHIEHLGEGQLSRRDLLYDRKRNRYRCPQNHYLYPYEKLDHRSIKRYRTLGGHCRQCPVRVSCLPEKHRHRARFVYRSPHQDEIDRIKKRQVTPHFKRKLAERQWKAEGVFGEAKGRHGLRCARYRGHAKMQIQLCLMAITQNLKRLVSRIYDFLWLLRSWLFRSLPPQGLLPCPYNP